MAAELLGGAILSTFVERTIDNLASRFTDYFRGKKLNKELLSELKLQVRCIGILANDAEQKQFRESSVRDWLLKAKDVVYDAEDLLAEIDVQLSKCQGEAEPKTIVGQVTSFLQPSTASSFENEMEWMGRILKAIKDLLKESEFLGLKKDSGVGVGSGSGSNESWKNPSTSLPSESVIYGRHDDKETIIKWLTSETDNKLSILSIVGMGGLGKTTLAQHVYYDSKIEGQFDKKAWVYVSDHFDVLKVTRTILERITGSTDDSRDLEMIHTRLKQNLSGKKFLLVLDDVWNEDWRKWDDVQGPLVAFGAEGSRILVTTRSNEVASTMRSKKHNLKELQQDHCWELFAKHAFLHDDNRQSISDYHEIGTKIVKKCKGLPLALKSMGSLLRNESSVSEWQSILKSEVWQSEDNNIVPALALSYLHLLPHHRRCFAYCALFPKDYVFYKEHLIQLWMGENFLRSNEQNRSPENVGERIFSDLLSRSFFQQSSNFGDGFVMHDLLNDLAKFVCGDICFRLGVDRAQRIPKTIRHFSFSISENKDFDGFGCSHDGESLRTFMPTYDEMEYVPHWQFKVPMNDFLSKLKFLRVLSLFGCETLTEVPQSVGNLKHLRSLDLSNTSIEKLPESLCSLFNLQILKLNGCGFLKELPQNLHRFTRLQRLEFKETLIRKVPPHLGKLKNLQVCMSSFDVRHCREFTIQQLGELNVQGSLSIKNLQKIENPSDALAMGLKNKTHLVELKLKWGDQTGDEDELEWGDETGDEDELEWNEDGLLLNRNLDDLLKEREENVIMNLQPSKQLKHLSIKNYGGTKFPSWLFDNSLSNVVSLKLVNCPYCQHLPSLGLLPSLKDLWIVGLDGIVSIDADFYGSESSSFTSLETLKFCDMKEWERWECEGVTGAFPRLQHLSVKNCPKKGAKLVQNLHLFPTLNSLTLIMFPDLQMISVEHAHNHLKNLTITKSHGLESLLQRMAILLPSLEKLVIIDCPRAKWIPGGYLPSNLKRMHISNCSKLMVSLKGAFGANPSLKWLIVWNLDVESFPDEGLLPLSLTRLSILNCESLKNVEYKGLCHLSSLKRLDLSNCPKLECLPEEGLPKSISYLEIVGCPMLKQRCQVQTGEDLAKIAHIQNLHVL